MSSRKLNQVRNSFYVYLPRQWCDSFGLTKDSEVRMQQLTDGSLLVLPPGLESRATTALRVDISDSSTHDLQSVLTGAYIVGATEVELNFKGKIDLTVRERISEWIRRLPGYEVLEEDSSMITISDTSEKQMILPILKRQFSTTKFMLGTLVHAMLEGKVEDADRIIARDEDVDRHRYFVERMCHIALRNPAYARKVQITSSDCLHFSMAAKKVERIADHICGAAADFVEQKVVDRAVSKSAEEVAVVYDDTMQAFFAVEPSGMDITNSVRGDEAAFAVVQEASKLAEKIAKQEVSPKVSNPELALLLMHLERISSYSADTCEIAINRMISNRLDAVHAVSDTQ